MKYRCNHCELDVDLNTNLDTIPCGSCGQGILVPDVEWKELKIDNLPPDILKWDRQSIVIQSWEEWPEPNGGWVDKTYSIGAMLNYASHGARHRYRRKQKPVPTHEAMAKLVVAESTKENWILTFKYRKCDFSPQVIMGSEWKLIPPEE